MSQEYFSEFTSDPLGIDLAGQVSARVEDPGGPALPFDYLDPRAFEVLAYSLMLAERPNQHTVLMQGSGERGRDCVVYSNGVIKTIIQCKNYRDRIGLPLVVREILKVALQGYLEPSLIPPGTGYELWVGGGLSEPAEAFFATWPNSWSEPLLVENISRVLGQYARFDQLRWDDVREFVVETFPKLVAVSRVEPIALSGRVRSHPKVYSQFFGGTVVAPIADLEAIVGRALARQTTALTDADAKRVVERIMSFGPDERLVFFSTVVLGLSPAIVAQFKRSEYEEFAKRIVGVTYDIVSTVMTVAQRLAFQRTTEFRRMALPCHPALTQLVMQLLTFSMLTRLQHVGSPKLVPDPWKAYHQMSVDERIDEHIGWGYDDYVTCMTKYDPAVHPPGSDPEFRNRIAIVALDGARSRDEFEAAVRKSVLERRALISSTYDEWMAQIPSQLLVISDSLSVFEDPDLFARFVANTQNLSRLRGSDVIPE